MKSSLNFFLIVLLLSLSYFTTSKRAELDEDDTLTDQTNLLTLIHNTNSNLHSQNLPFNYPKLRQRTTAKKNQNIILCSKVNKVQVTYANGFEETHYNCQFFSNDVKNIESYELPIMNINDYFIQKREEAYMQGMESLYIKDGKVVNNEVILPDNEERSIIWFGKDTNGVNQNITSHYDDIKSRRRLADKQFGVKIVLVVRISANGKSPFPTSQQLSQAVFGTPSSSNSDNTLNSQYKACSKNQLSFQPARGKTTAGLMITNGVVNINLGTTYKINTKIPITDVYMLANFAKAKIGQTSIYDHVMYDFPDGTTYYSRTSWIGFAIVGGYESFYGTGTYTPRGGIWMTSSSMIVHEVAHNFGLMHSNQYNTEYEDTTCTMGFSNLVGYQNRCFNGAKLVELGWHESSRIEVIKPLTDGTWEGKLIGIHDLNSNMNSNLSEEYKLVLEIHNSSSSTWRQSNLYVTYNVAEGITQDTGEHINQIIIVEAIPGAKKTMSWSKSNLIGNIGQGQTFVDSTFLGDRELQITVKKMGTDKGNIDYADVNVKIKNESCTSNESCNDQNICSIDSCNIMKQICSYVYTSNCCGNGICEINAGESCFSCPDDCKLPNDCSEVTTGKMLIARFGYEGFYIDMQAKDRDIIVQSIFFYAIPADPLSDTITINVYTKFSSWLGDSTNIKNSWKLLTDSWILIGTESIYTIDGAPIYHYTVSVMQYIPKYSRQAFYIISEEDNVTLMHGGTSDLNSNQDPISTSNTDVIVHDIGLANLPLFNDEHFISRRKFHGAILYSTHTTSTTPFQLFKIPNQSFNIISSLSSTYNQWCLYARNNYLEVNTKLAITQCESWNSLKWFVDDDGKIHNLKEPSLCIQRTGKRMVLRKCKDGLSNQRWRYNYQQKLFSRNGEIGAIVEGNGRGVKKNLFVNQERYSNTTTKNKEEEQWYLHSISIGIVNASSYTFEETPFQIILNTNSNTKKYCLIPRKYSFINGVKLIIQNCQSWNAYLWTMDSQGKLHSYKTTNKCITRRGKRIIIHSCQDNSKAQKWVYNLLDNHLSPLINGQVSMTLTNENNGNENQVMSLPRDRNKSYQTWRLEKIGN